MIWGQNESRGQNDTRHGQIAKIIKPLPGGIMMGGGGKMIFGGGKMIEG